jgi:5-methylcytosine-specific restriction endonuclease McrA
MNKTQYSAYLQSDHWQRVRTRRLNFARFRCEHCGYHATLQVHHLTYARIRQESQADLIVLCDRCHRTIEEIIGDRLHSRKGKAVALRRYTHKRLRLAGIPMVFHATGKQIDGMSIRR